MPNLMFYFLILFLPIVTPAQVNVLTANYGNDRTNANLAETVLTTANVGPGSFGKLGAYAVDGQIYAQPLVAGGVMIDGAPRNVVYVATMHNSLYAFDADDAGSTRPLWQVNFGRSVPAEFLKSDSIRIEVGILSTPVIDLSRNTIFAVSDTFEGGTPVFRLHALDLSDGSEKQGGSVEIKALVDGDGDSSRNGKIPLDPVQHIQRPGLLLANGRVYIAFGSHEDAYPYHGWVLAYDASDIRRQAAVFNTTPHGGSASVWQAGRGPAADRAGIVLLPSG